MLNSNYVYVDTDILGGTPVFKGTRVPVSTLFDYLEGNQTVEDFIDDFPSVQKELVVSFLKENLINPTKSTISLLGDA